MTFIVPVLIFRLQIAIVVAVAWGLLLLSIFSFCIAKKEKAKPWKVVAEHIMIAVVVVAISHFVGKWVAATFG